MIAVDTNLLVHAHREDSPWHQASYARVRELAEGRAPWAIAWPCIHEFLAIVTHPLIYAPPTPLDVAMDQVKAWMESPNLVLLCETEQYWAKLRAVLSSGRITGARVLDARIAALCQHHGVSELWTVDRDFSRFPGITVRNPLAE